MLLTNIGNRIKFIRINRAKLSQEEMAQLLGYDKAYLCRIENGKQNISIESLDKICKCLKVSLKDFFDFENIDVIKMGDYYE